MRKNKTPEISFNLGEKKEQPRGGNRLKVEARFPCREVWETLKANIRYWKGFLNFSLTRAMSVGSVLRASFQSVTDELEGVGCYTCSFDWNPK